MSKMYIAESEHMKLWVPEHSHFSFFNSPYIGHREGGAIDIYSRVPLFPFEEGEVIEIRKVRTPTHIPVSEDFLIAFRLNDELCLKTLHVKPTVKIGEKLSRGDEFGKLILSGFFMPWSDKHVHVELRRCDDRYRARGAMKLRPIIQELVPSSSQNLFEIVEKKEHFYWIRPLKREEKKQTPIKENDFAIEGGLPHYGHGAVFGNVKKLNFFGKEIECREQRDNLCLFDSQFYLYANSQKIKGIGTYSNLELVKMLGGNFEEGEIIEIRAR